MANNNIPSIPTFVPRIIMVATNSQQTQTPHTTSTSFSVQTDRQVLQSNATQTQTSQRTISTQTSPTQTSRSVQTEHMIDHTQTTDFTNDDASLETMNEPLQPLREVSQVEKEKLLQVTKFKKTKKESKFHTR